MCCTVAVEFDGAVHAMALGGQGQDCVCLKPQAKVKHLFVCNQSKSVKSDPVFYNSYMICIVRQLILIRFDLENRVNACVHIFSQLGNSEYLSFTC